MFGTLSKKNQICIKYENGYFPPLLRYVKYKIKKIISKIKHTNIISFKEGSFEGKIKHILHLFGFQLFPRLFCSQSSHLY